jgi:2,3,4,5-tetrahydropyridine-2-carboxylate N-succinyltransferase
MKLDQNTLAAAINEAWENRDNIQDKATLADMVDHIIGMIDSGALRVASPKNAEGSNTGGPDAWQVNEWVKKAILLSFRLNPNAVMSGGPNNAPWWDKVPMKFEGWQGEDFKAAGFRAVPGCFVRRGSFVDKDAVLMPCFINIGAHVGAGTMIDTWATVGSCAQIGANCHISGGTGIGGVLEPLQASPVIIEDNVFVGARSEIAEGVHVGTGAVISMGVFIGASTKIINRDTGEITQGSVPPYSVIVPGTLPGKTLPDGSPGPSLACAVIVKQVDERTRSKTGINELLRD